MPGRIGGQAVAQGRGALAPSADGLMARPAAAAVDHLEIKGDEVEKDFGEKRTIVEALYFALKREEYDDPYKGQDNHLIYNCVQGDLPETGELERRLLAMTEGSFSLPMPGGES